ncbi:MAG TPA: VOC family protein [Candidatus Binatia bacterium]|jgi:catechol 2,3-dioxygenase-like lactoylglutathione lyase family enzyme
MAFARIRHVAIYTENYDKTSRFYRDIFGMKQITTGMTDEKGEYNPNRGHLSDGVMGLALLQRHAGIRSGLDHFGFEVESGQTVMDRLKKYPEVRVTSSLEHVPFAVMRIQDPSGTHMDVSQQGVAKVREGYLEKGWEQPRHLDHVAIRTARPAYLAQFYQDVFELRPVESGGDGGQLCVSDGKVSIVIIPTENKSYRSMTEGLDHIGFKVDALKKADDDLQNLARNHPESKPKQIDLGRFGPTTLAEIDACMLGRRSLADPDGVLMDLVE